MSKHGPPPSRVWRRIAAGIVIGAALFGAGYAAGHGSTPAPQVTAAATSCSVAVSGHSVAVPSGAVLSQPGAQIGCDNGTVAVHVTPAAPVHVALPPLAAHVLHVWHVLHVLHLAHLAYLAQVHAEA